MQTCFLRGLFGNSQTLFCLFVLCVICLSSSVVMWRWRPTSQTSEPQQSATLKSTDRKWGVGRMFLQLDLLVRNRTLEAGFFCRFTDSPWPYRCPHKLTQCSIQRRLWRPVKPPSHEFCIELPSIHRSSPGASLPVAPLLSAPPCFCSMFLLTVHI